MSPVYVDVDVLEGIIPTKDVEFFIPLRLRDAKKREEVRDMDFGMDDEAAVDESAGMPENGGESSLFVVDD